MYKKISVLLFAIGIMFLSLYSINDSTYMALEGVIYIAYPILAMEYFRFKKILFLSKYIDWSDLSEMKPPRLMMYNYPLGAKTEEVKKYKQYLKDMYHKGTPVHIVYPYFNKSYVAHGTWFDNARVICIKIKYYYEKYIQFRRVYLIIAEAFIIATAINASNINVYSVSLALAVVLTVLELSVQFSKSCKVGI